MPISSLTTKQRAWNPLKIQPPGYPAKAVDIERVNVELAGEDPVENVLANLKPELAKLLKKYQLFQFIPLCRRWI